MTGQSRLADSRLLGGLAAFGLFLLSRPFQGVRHDGRLYVADALAKLDPHGVGRDLLFVHDGQFGFSLYTPLLARLIGVLGISGGTLAVVLVTLTLWFVALALLVERLLVDRAPGLRWAALVFAVALPSLYDPLDVIGFGEPYATPRGLAEAAGLLGMAAYLSGRRVLGLGVCLVGMLFHPIMGLCAAAAIGVAIALEDRRWLWAGLAALATVTIAGLLHLPLADRMVTVMDPAWRSIVEMRSPILFPSLWSSEAWGRLTVQACTLAAAVSLLSGAPRRLALGALIAGLAGVAATAVLGDGLSLLLFLQAQAWRTLQPMAVLALVGLAILCADLPKRGPSGVIGLALLGLAWMVRDLGDLGLFIAPVGLAFVLLGDRMRLSRPAIYAGVAIGLISLAGVGYAALRAVALEQALARMPEAWPFSEGFVWGSDLPSLAIATAVGLWLARGWKAPGRPLCCAVALILSVLALMLWDDRSAYVRHRDAGRDVELTALIAARPGPVLWLAGDVEPWILAGRPSWSSKVQSAGVVFSRPLATQLWSRARRLEDAGLAGRDWIRPLSVPALAPPALEVAKVWRFCAAHDAPAWIIAPIWDGEGGGVGALDPALRPQFWSPAAPYVEDLSDASGRRWRTARGYAVIPCRGA